MCHRINTTTTNCVYFSFFFLERLKKAAYSFCCIFLSLLSLSLSLSNTHSPFPLCTLRVSTLKGDHPSSWKFGITAHVNWGQIHSLSLKTASKLLYRVTVAQLVERVGLCSEGRWFDTLPIGSWSLCPWARHLTHTFVNVYDCCMFVVVVGVAVGAECAATLPSVRPRAAVATIVVYHHQYGCVWTNGTWKPARCFEYLEKRYTNPIHYYLLYYHMKTLEMQSSQPHMFELSHYSSYWSSGELQLESCRRRVVWWLWQDCLRSMFPLREWWGPRTSLKPR